MSGDSQRTFVYYNIYYSKDPQVLRHVDTYPLDLCFHMFKLSWFVLYNLFRNNSPLPILKNSIWPCNKGGEKNSTQGRKCTWEKNVFACSSCPLMLGNYRIFNQPILCLCFLICKMVTKSCLLFSWHEQNTNKPKGSGLIPLSAPAVDGGTFSCNLLTVISRINIIVCSWFIIIYF